MSLGIPDNGRNTEYDMIISWYKETTHVTHVGHVTHMDHSVPDNDRVDE